MQYIQHTRVILDMSIQIKIDERNTKKYAFGLFFSSLEMIYAMNDL